MNAKLLFSLARPTSGRSKYPGGCRLLYARRVFSLLGLWLLMNQTASWGQCFQNILDPTAYRLYPVGQGPYSVAVGDFNGDGKPDLATANFLNSVSVLLGDGAGGFGNRADFGAGFGASSVAIGDFNGDGKLDLVAANLFDNTVSVLLGTGTGSFGANIDFAVGSDPESVAVGDFNGDGKPDLVTANGGSGNVTVLLGNGQGSFAPATGFSVGDSPRSVVVADLNGDGKPDLVTANRGSDNVTVLRGDGAGGFGNRADLAVGESPQSVIITDLNRDGKAELVTVNTRSVSVRLGDGAGGFAPNTDFAGGGAARSGAIGDFNGDGKADLFTVNNTYNTVSILLGDGAGGFGPNTDFKMSGGPSSVVVGDFNGDGKLDLVTALFNDNTVLVQRGDGAGHFALKSTFEVAGAPNSVAVGDFNGDGKPDLATANYYSNTVSVLLATGTGSFATFTRPTSYEVGATPVSVAVGDFNGDGKADLVTANSNAGKVSVLLGDGAGGFSNRADFGVDSYPRSVAVGDFNGDGKPDLVTASNILGTVTVLLGDGTGGFGNRAAFGVGSAQSVAIGDFNGDGKADLVTAGYNTVGVLLGTGTGSFGANTNFAVGSNTYSVAVGDFNGDGKLDVVAANYGANTVSVLLGTGTGSFGTKTDFAVGSLPYSVAVGDVNGDGKLDVVAANPGVEGGYPGSGTVSVLLGKGTGSFGAKTDFSVGVDPESVAVADLNGDGKPDLVTANYSDVEGNIDDNTVAVLYNCTDFPLLLATSASPNPVCAGTSLALSATVTGGSAPYRFSWAAPAGITLSATSTSAVSASVGAGVSGVQTITLTAAASGGTPSSTSFISVTVNAAPTNPSLSSGTLTCAQTSVTLTASGGTSYTFANGSGILGTPGVTNRLVVTTPGTYSVTVANASGCVRTTTTSVVSATGLVSVSNPATGTATVGVAFSQPFMATGGTSPYSYSLASGNLPTGLSLATTGVLSGTPTQSGSFTITVRGRDVNGCSDVSEPCRLTVSASASVIRYVKAGGAGNRSGNSWADASDDLQSQIDFVGAQQVWVAQGTYKPGGTDNTDRTLSFAMRNGVSILGGFAAGGTPTLAQRNPGSFTTVLSGDIGTIGSNADNSYHVVNNGELTATAVLDGFIIRDGKADNDYGSGRNNGGGMYNNSSSPTVINCSFLSNSAVYGGGMFNQGGSPNLINCSFLSNSGFYGGGINNSQSSPGLTNCSFLSNSASAGGGIFNFNSNPSLTNCVLYGNGGAKTFANGNSSTSATYSLLETSITGYSGDNNLTTTASPFVSSTDARLNGCSPAINTGLNSANATTTDLAGNPRFFNSRIDMGAYEYQAAPTTIITTVPAVSTATVGEVFSQTFTASGGTSPYSYSLASGSLPTGLSLATTGVLSGTPTQSGSFTLTVLGRDASGCSGISAAYVLTVSEPASVMLTGLAATPNAVCVGSPVTFTATVGNVTGSYSYTLTNGLSAPLTGSASGTLFSQSITANGMGTQRFTLTVTANGQSASSETPLTVNPLPVASLTNNGPLSCAHSSVTLTAGGGSSYTFASGSGVLGTPGPVNALVVSTPGTYSVTVASASGCVSTTSTIVTADQTAPSVSITPSSATLTCASPTVRLSAVGSGSVRWSTGETSPSISVNAAGPYSVTATSDNGCSAVASATVSQDNTAPSASLLSSGNLSCGVSSVTLTANPNGQTGATLAYRFSAGATQIGSSNQATVSSPGLYSVTVISGNGCTAMASVSVSQDASAPLATLSASPSTTLSCTQTSLTLTAGGGNAYAFAGPGVVSQSGNQAIVNASGTYSVTVSNGANGCSAVAQTTVTSDQTVPAVSITATPSLAITQGQSATLTASGGAGQPAVSYAWSTSENTPAIVVSTAGPYSVTGTSANGCSASASVTLTVQPLVSGPFAITGVTVVSCSPILPNRFSLSFTPRYQGLDGSPVSFSVTNELLPTTQPGPYTLQVYSDNPVITLEARQNGAATRYAYNWLEACNSSTSPNTPPRVVNGIPGQTATVGQFVSYVIPGGTFTDAETPGSLQLSARGLPIGLTFSGATLSGTPSSTVGSPVSITITATDPGGLSVSTLLSLTVLPASGNPPPSSPFALTGVTTISCTPVANRISLVFAPRYGGLNGQPIAFGVDNELSSTTDAGPYSLSLYRDNPVITLRATQSGSDGPVMYAYNWLAGCTALGQDNTPPRLNEPVAGQTAVVGQGYSLNLSNTFIDQETPTQVILTASGLPLGLGLSGQAITGTPSLSGVSSVTLTATDGGGLSTSTVFSFTVVPALVTPPPTATFSLTGVTTVSCEVLSAGERRVTFTPRYAGLDGSPVSFSVVNELVSTTAPGPYSLNLYTDNAVITLSAVQGGVVSRFSYGWLSACNPGARLGSGSEVPLRVTVLGNPVVGASVEIEVRGAEGQPLRLSLTDERGRLVSEQAIPMAGVVERQTLKLGHQPGGILVLRVSTPTQSQTVKVIKP